MLENTTKQLIKLRTKSWVERNDESRGKNNKDNQIRFKTSMLRSNLCDYSEACIFVKGIIAVATETNAAPNNVNKMAIFKNCVPLTNFMGRINNAQVAETSDVNVLMPMYNLVEYSDI